MSNQAKIIAPAVWVLVLAAMLVIGCGKKAPPVAPRHAPLIQVTDLHGGLNKGTVRLTWHHSPENAHAVGYIVLRAQSALIRPECPGCPLVFQKVDTITMRGSQRKKKHALEFYQDVVEGFRYTYSVRPYQSSGAQGPDSNLVVMTSAEGPPETMDKDTPP